MQPAAVVRTLARILSLLIVLTWGYFAIAHVLGDAGSPSRSLVVYDYVAIATMFVSLAGLAIAWKWEFAGALITLVTVALGAMVNWRVLLSPLSVIPINALLFLACAWMSRLRQ